MGRKKIDNRDRTFGRILGDLMAEKGMTLTELSARTGVSTSTLGDWRSSAVQPADYRAVKKVAKVLGVSMSFLLTGETDDTDMIKTPTLAEVLGEGDSYSGIFKISIQRLVPKSGKKAVEDADD